MPRVQLYADNAVPLPKATDARFATADNKGGVGAALGGGLQRLGDALSDYAEAQFERDLHRARERELEAARRLQEIRDGVTGQSGFLAETALADAQRAIDESRMDLVRSASTVPMRQMLADVFDQRARILRHDLTAHVEQEKFRAKLDVSARRQALAEQDAITARTPLAFRTNVQTAFDEIGEQATLMGQTAPDVDAARARMLSGLHYARFERLLDSGDREGALAYCATHTVEMSRVDVSRATAQLGLASWAPALQANGPQDITVTAPQGTQQLNDEIAGIEHESGQPVTPDTYEKMSQTMGDMNQWLQGASATRSAGGTYVAPELGSLSKNFEAGGAGGPGTVSSPGRGDKGGISYGSYQLKSEPSGGTAKEFLASNEGAPWRTEFAGLTPGSAAFGKKWQEIAQREAAKFGAAQTRFIGRSHYDVVVRDTLAATGLDLDARSEAVRNAAWSAAVHHLRKAPPRVFIPAIRAADKATGGNRDDPRYDELLLNSAYSHRVAFMARLEAYQRKLAAQADAKLAVLDRIGNRRLSPAQRSAKKKLEDSRSKALAVAKQFRSIQIGRLVSEPKEAIRMLKEQVDAGDWPK